MEKMLEDGIVSEKEMIQILETLMDINKRLPKKVIIEMIEELKRKIRES